jgi:transposase InsO family protein
MDITEHPTSTGKVYLAMVIDAFSRRVIGWSIADHMRVELVADALQMATWQRQPTPGGVAHPDHGAQYGSWLFRQRFRDAGLLGSMGSIGDAYDNSVAEAFFSIIQRELFDQHEWATRDQLAAAIITHPPRS